MLINEVATTSPLGEIFSFTKHVLVAKAKTHDYKAKQIK
jgi:hypothetical protein